ncbi:immunity 53 family protein [Crocosphaera chwakensis]|uniref:Rhodanese-related sulfurtransferase n=1 Tax=Crocosphaera chwakensis CCY0110 TaxID=391612 RepID=A3IM60_9CHRO|nr:immunity 53 family protein [Crocosphaera chwakensis]EAZ92516.1 hypothetical protein CY0110_02284 [Crocosphaera chwakensis CCY0110]
MIDNSFIWLLNWYRSQCDSEWEHSYGIKIETVDNPGWWVSIDISETELEDFSFEMIEIERSEENWFFCKVENNKFQGGGGVLNLVDILDTFKAWAISVRE